MPPSDARPTTWTGAAPGSSGPLVSICVCTFRRGRELERLLRCLTTQRLPANTPIEIVVVDNDEAGSGREATRRVCDAFPDAVIRYAVEPRPGVAHARNRCLHEARGAFVAFLDDDEYCGADWLSLLLETQRASGATAVLGPVVPEFPDDAPEWVRRSGVFDRWRPPTGTELGPEQCRTGNVLFDAAAIRRRSLEFDIEFAASGGEDVLFFHRLAQASHRFVWADEAVAWEEVAPQRINVDYLLRRSFSGGTTYVRIRNRVYGPGESWRHPLKGLVAGTVFGAAALASWPVSRARSLKLGCRAAAGWGKFAALFSVRGNAYAAGGG
jgi:succinoglycan biosynthesis protein ExoM